METGAAGAYSFSPVGRNEGTAAEMTGDLSGGFARSNYNSNVGDTALIEVELVNVFREQLSLERALERAKVDLSLRTDFNLIDAFRIFDVEGKGWISPDEIK